jgi:hypothetical protein
MIRAVQPRVKHLRWSETLDGGEWDEFVREAGGSVFHSWAWRGVVAGEESRPVYLAYRDAGGRISAVCPLVRRPGRRLVYMESLPDSHFAGPLLGDWGIGASVALAGLGGSIKFRPNNPVVAMRLRVSEPRTIEALLRLGFKHKLTYGLFVIDLLKTPPQHIWSHGFQKHDRQAVKYYDQKGPGFGFATKDEEYAQFLRLRRGSTNHEFDRGGFVAKIRTSLGGRLGIGLVKVGDEVVAGTLVLRDDPCSAVRLMILRFNPTRRIHSSVTYLNWKVINWAHGQGYRYCDLGPYNILASSDPNHHFQKLKARFEADLLPRYDFTLPTSALSYSLARGIERAAHLGRHE